MIYRGVEITEIKPNHIKLFFAQGVHKDGGNLYTNGERYVSIPPAWAGRESDYGKLIIDRTYEWATYHKAFETRYIK